MQIGNAFNEQIYMIQFGSPTDQTTEIGEEKLVVPLLQTLW